MSPVVLVLTIWTAVAVLFLPRKYAFAAVLGVTFLTPFGQQLYFGGFHFFVIRIIILVGFVRLLLKKGTSAPSPFANGYSSLDKIFFLWAFLRAITFILLYREVGAAVAQGGFLLDTCGGYIIFRYFLHDENDISD